MHASTRLPNISSRKLKPFVSAEELSRRPISCKMLQLDRLEEFGFSREAIEDMAEMINDDLFNLPPDRSIVMKTTTFLRPSRSWISLPRALALQMRAMMRQQRKHPIALKK